MKQGTIYIIKCKDKSIKDCYIGSTSNLELRKQRHEYDCMDNKSKVYQFMRKNGNFNNFEFEILEDNIEFNNRIELLKIERYYIEEFKSNLNSEIPSRTRKEWTITNKDKIKEINKKYRENNKDKTKEYDKIRNQTEKRQEWIKKYREENKDKVKEKRKEKMKVKINCSCGSIISKPNYAKHCKSKKHLQYMENNN